MNTKNELKQIIASLLALVVIGAVGTVLAFAYSSEQADGTDAADDGADWANVTFVLTDNAASAITPEGTVVTSAITVSGFTTSIPAGAKIVGIEIREDAYYTTAGGSCGKRNHTLSLSWNGGTSYTNTKSTGAITTMEVTYTMGSATDTWNRAWATSELGANFYIKMTGTRANCIGDGIGHACEYLSRTIYYRTRRRVTIGANFTEHLAAVFKSKDILLLHPSFKAEESPGRFVSRGKAETSS